MRYLLVLCLLGLSLHKTEASPIRATIEPQLWNSPGAAPFRGEPEDGLNLLSRFVPNQVRERLFRLVKETAGQTYTLPPGTVLYMTFTDSEGNHHVAYMEIPEGLGGRSEARVWEYTHEGRFYQIVLPTVCGNWSYIVPSEPPPLPLLPGGVWYGPPSLVPPIGVGFGPIGPRSGEFFGLPPVVTEPPTPTPRDRPISSPSSLTILLFGLAVLALGATGSRRW
jgi:hypothetical protein